MSEELDELRRLGDSFAATINEQGRQVETGLRSVSAGLDRAADRIAAAMGSGGGMVNAPVAAAATTAAAAPTGGPAIAPGGIVLVRVVNDRVPVFVLNPPPGPSVASQVATGAGGFLGGLLGGIFSGFAAPIIGLADIIALMAGLPGILDRVMNILREVRAIARELVAGIRGLVILLFSELTAAGIFPVSRLIASLLFLIDRGITLVLMHIQPIIVWVERVIETVTTWLGAYISRLAAFISGLVNSLATFLAAYVAYMIDTIVRPAVDAIVRDAIRSAVSAFAGMLFGVLGAAGEILVAAGSYIGQLIYRSIIQALNYLPGVSITVPGAPASPNWGALARSAMSGGQVLGRDLAEALLGPAPVRPPSGSGRAGGAPGVPPVFHGPGFRAPELHLPDMPQPSPQLERLLEQGPAAVGPQPEQGAHPLTVNGGVSVAIRSETVSMENAEETARVIAQHVMDELARLNQAERFGRGLPTASVA